MKKVKGREVLSACKFGPEYWWFNLRVAGMPELTIGSDVKCIWDIDENMGKPVAYIQRKYDQSAGESKRHLRVKRVRIVGPREQIKNLLYNLGEGIPNERIGPRWEEKEEESIPDPIL